VLSVGDRNMSAFYSSLIPRSAEHALDLRVTAKIRDNIRASKPVAELDADDRRIVRRRFLNETIWIPTRSLRHALRDRANNNIVNFPVTKPRLRPLETHATFRFIDELLVRRMRYKNTLLYRRMANGEKDARFERGKQTRFGEEGDDPYHAKCLALIDSMRRDGVRDLRCAGGGDSNIGVAIGDDGRFLHYKRGHHRLAIAAALGIEWVPVDVLWISGEFLTNATSAWRLPTVGGLRRSFRRAVDTARARADRPQNRHDNRRIGLA
jgi:hypothetical protein